MSGTPDNDATGEVLRLAWDSVHRSLASRRGVLLLLVFLACIAGAGSSAEDCHLPPPAGVPYNLCTPFPKPTLAEWNRGWRWASPDAPISSVPSALGRAWTGEVALSVCYLGADAPPRAEKCSDRYPGLAGMSAIRLESWCAYLRALPVPPASANPAAVQGPPPRFDGVCGS